MTNRIKAEIMKNRQKGENLTKPIETVTIFPLAKSQNEANPKNPFYKTISFQTPFSQNKHFTKQIVAKTKSPPYYRRAL
jgi:hypothetical protein